jgi:hypothetical protein
MQEIQFAISHFTELSKLQGHLHAPYLHISCFWHGLGSNNLKSLHGPQHEVFPTFLQIEWKCSHVQRKGCWADISKSMDAVDSPANWITKSIPVWLHLPCQSPNSQQLDRTQHCLSSSIFVFNAYQSRLRIQIRFNNRNNAESAILLADYSPDGSLASRTSSFFLILSGSHAFDVFLHMNEHEI